MAVNSVPTAGNYPTRFNKREAKVIETALSGTGSITNKTIGTTNTIDVKDSGFQVTGSSDVTKILKVEVDGMTAAKTFTISPVSDVNSILKIDMTGSTTAKFLSLKAAVSADRTVTFQDATCTMPVVKKAVIASLTAGGATHTETIAGVVATDIVLVTMHTLDADSRTFVKAEAGSGNVVLTFAGGVLGAGGKANIVVLGPQ
jgi:hypothetical protein